jgi:hypothetical protein
MPVARILSKDSLARQKLHRHPHCFNDLAVFRQQQTLPTSMAQHQKAIDGIFQKCEKGYCEGGGPGKE